MSRTVQGLRSQLGEADELLRAIRSGEVDALVVNGPLGDQTYTLSGAEHPYRVMVETMSEGAVILTAEGTIFYSNRSFGAMVGAPLEDVIGAKMGRFVFPEDLPWFYALTRQVGVGILRGEIRLTCTGGSIVPVQLSISAYDSGTPGSACAVITDLTEHKRHQALMSAEALERAKRAEAEAAQQRIASVLESITDAFFSVDREWRITDANQRAAASFGLTRDELLGAAFWEISPPGIVPELDEQYRNAMDGRAAVHIEECSPIAQGKWFDRHIYPTDEGLAVYFRDVSKRRRSEEALRASEERKRTEKELRRSEANLAEAQRLSHTGSWALNVSTGEMFWSLEHFRICGVNPETFTVTTESARELIHPLDRASAIGTFDRALQHGRDFDHEFRMVRPDGTIISVHSLAHPVCNEAGEVTEYIGTLVDMTERKEADQERARLLRQVVQAQEDERRRIALEMHDQFGQKLSALVLKLSSLKRELGPDTNPGRQLASLEGTTRQLDADLELIVSQLRPPALDDLGLLAALTHYIERWSEDFHIRANLHASGIERDGLTDEIDTSLYRITQEALTNIAKHAQARSVAILLSRNRDRVSLIVEDDGIGVVAEPTARRHRSGVPGMRERARLLGGTVDVESRAGKGTTVVVRIPIPADSPGKAI